MQLDDIRPGDGNLQLGGAFMLPKKDTRVALLDAARLCLQRDGYAGLSTRRVADEAGVKLSQIHYYFGSKTQLVLSLLERENEQRLERQANMYAEDAPLSVRWKQACDFLEEDLATGYVRILQEMMAAGWSDPALAEAVRDLLRGWFDLLERVAAEASERFGGLGPFEPRELAALIGDAFLGAEAVILLGFGEPEVPSRSSLRKIGELIAELERAHERGE